VGRFAVFFSLYLVGSVIVTAPYIAGLMDIYALIATHALWLAVLFGLGRDTGDVR